MSWQNLQKKLCLVGIVSLLAGCQLIPYDFFKKNEPEPVVKQEPPKPVVDPQEDQTTIVTTIAPIIPHLTEEFLLQPEVTYVPPPKKIRRRSSKTTAEVQLFDHVFAFSLPRKWEQTNMKIRSGYRRFEYAPTYKSILGQDEISIEAFQNYNNHYTAQQLIDSYVMRAKARCRDMALYESLGKGKLNGFNTAEAIYGCTANTQQSKQTSMVSYVMAVEAGGNMLLFNKKLKTRPFKLTNSPLTHDNVKRFLAPIQPILLCDDDKAEAGCGA